MYLFFPAEAWAHRPARPTGCRFSRRVRARQPGWRPRLSGPFGRLRRALFCVSSPAAAGAPRACAAGQRPLGRRACLYSAASCGCRHTAPRQISRRLGTAREVVWRRLSRAAWGRARGCCSTRSGWPRAGAASRTGGGRACGRSSAAARRAGAAAFCSIPHRGAMPRPRAPPPSRTPAGV